MKKNSFLSITLFSVVGILFFLLNYYTPLLHDDLAYLYQFGSKAEVRPTNLPVENLGDVFRSQYYHYLDVNGRFTSHFLLQLLLLFGKNIFNIFNVLVFLGLIYLVNLYSKNKENIIFIYVFILVSIWFLMPFFGQTILWTTGAINYLWTSCFVVLFIIIFRKQKEQPIENPLKIALLFLMSLFIAWMNESVTFGVAVALFIYFLFNFKNIKRSEFFMLLGFGLGVLLIVFSPGTFNRVGNEAQIKFSLKRKILDIIAILFLLKWKLLISVVLLIFNKLKKQNLFQIFRDNFIIITAIVFNNILFLLIGNIEERMIFGNSVFILVFNVYLLKNILKSNETKWLGISSFFLFLLFCFGYYQAFSVVKKYNVNHLFFENEIKISKNGIVYFPNFENSRFVNHTLSGNSDFRNYHNRVRAFYYHVPEVNVLQEDLFKNIFPINNIFTKEYQIKNWEKPVYYFKNILLFEMPQDFNYQHRIDAELMLGNENKKVKVDFIKLNGKNYTAFINISENEKTLLNRIVIQDNHQILLKLQKAKN